MIEIAKIQVVKIQTPLTVIDIAASIKPEGQIPFVFLDSSLVDDQLGRYAVIGRDPWFDCRVVDGQTYIDGERMDIEIWTAIRQFLQQHQDDLRAEELPFDLPFKAGLIGYFAYDLAIVANDRVTLPDGQDHSSPQAWLLAFDQMVIIDQIEAIAYLLAWGKLKDADLALAELKRDLNLNGPVSTTEPQSVDQQAHPVQDESGRAGRSNFSRAAYCHQVEAVRQAIGSGEVYILNLSQRFLLPRPCDAWTSYCQLRRVSPTPYAIYFQHGPMTVLSFSPEQFLRIRGRMVSTRPIKGTRPRGQTPQEDEHNRQELLASRKDRAELLMIVDLERNDLSQVCEPDSVVVSDLYRIESYSTVHHLVATIEGRLATGQDAVSCFHACFPGGSITGAPKIRAMQLISDFEHLRRGLYTGCMGYFSLDGQAEFNILIRTILSDDQSTTYHAGGGITWDSDPLAEYQETLDKASAIGGILS